MPNTFLISYSCAQITNEKGYTHFGIQNLGECRSGVNVDKSYASQGARVAYTHQGPRPWVGCIGKGMQQCKRPSLSCVGQDQTNYVYGLKDSKCQSLSKNNYKRFFGLLSFVFIPEWICS